MKRKKEAAADLLDTRATEYFRSCRGSFPFGTLDEKPRPRVITDSSQRAQLPTGERFLSIQSELNLLSLMSIAALR